MITIKRWRNAATATCIGGLLAAPLGWVVFASSYWWSEDLFGTLQIAYPVLVRCWLLAVFASCAALGSATWSIGTFVFTRRKARLASQVPLSSS
jgi:hypothetical protein